tara:strand:+ start:235 stop:858 length:624 start_codon:yes stop_codon:yes gene_type:complete
MPTLDLELQLHREGKSLVAGIDEVGRGPLAGPVMAGAVILAPDVSPSESWLRYIKDSKKLTALQRGQASKVVQEKALYTSLGLADPNEIDVLGIAKATRLAMLRAIKALPLRPQHLIIDFVTLEESNLPFTAVLGGDDKSYSIAAASIVAKVARDRLMVEANTLYPGYGFHIHKGYGTAQHLKSLQLLGPSPIHRFSFAPVRRARQT